MDNKLDPKVGALYTRPRRLDLGDHAMLDISCLQCRSSISDLGRIRRLLIIASLGAFPGVCCLISWRRRRIISAMLQMFRK